MKGVDHCFTEVVAGLELIALLAASVEKNRQLAHTYFFVLNIEPFICSEKLMYGCFNELKYLPAKSIEPLLWL
jgi:hypothetical protein